MASRTGAYVGGLVLVLVVAAGATQTEWGWPVASYPSFSRSYGPVEYEHALVVTDASGRSTDVDRRDAAPGLEQYRWEALLRRGTQSDAAARALFDAVAPGSDVELVQRALSTEDWGRTTSVEILARYEPSDPNQRST